MDYLQTLVDNRTLAFIALALAFLAGAVFQTIVSNIAKYRRMRRWHKQEQAAEWDATRILQGYRPDEYEEAISNEDYFEATTDGHGYRLKASWRQLIEDTKPRSPEIVAEETYQFRAVRPVRVEAIQEWPTWTQEELKVPGRRRASEDREAQRRVLLTETGSFKALDRRELTRV